MKKLIKKTVSINLGKEDYIIALMDKLSFKEIDRRSTGGYMSEEKLQITFEGYDKYYHENDYVRVYSGTGGFFYFYSLRCLEGYYTNTFDFFKSSHDKVSKFEVLSFDNKL